MALGFHPAGPGEPQRPDTPTKAQAGCNGERQEPAGEGKEEAATVQVRMTQMQNSKEI